MTVRAEKPKILSTIIIPVAVNVIDCQHQRLPIPNSFHLAKRTAIWNAYFNHRAPQLVCLFMMRERVAQNK